jgi:hypothetical protein
MTETKQDTRLQNFTLLEWKAAAIFELGVILVVTPFYNWFYRITVNFCGIGIFLVSVLVILFTFFRHIVKLRFASALVSLALGIIIVGTGLYVQEWRYQLTDYIIKARYCDLSQPLETEYLLGGIIEIRVDALPRRTGAFENSSSCLTVSCVEEFYYCSNAKLKIYR